MVWGWECLSWRRPTANVALAKPGTLNHVHAGVTRHSPPFPEALVAGGWLLDHTRVKVGRGQRQYDKAVKLLQQWQQMSLGWVDTNAPSVKKGAQVCVIARSLFVWSRLPLEVVYTSTAIDKMQLPAVKFPVHRRLTEEDSLRSSHRLRAPPGQRRRYCYATATQEGHQLYGEERFCVEHSADDSVWYEVFTVSKPATPLAHITRPFVRFHQRHFGRCSARKMADAVAEGASD